MKNSHEFTFKLSRNIVGVMCVTYPLYLITDHGIFSQAFIAQVIFALVIAGILGAASTTMVELFPVQSRCSGIGIGYNLSQAFIGGTAPMVSTWLIKLTGQIHAPATYLIFLGLISFFSLQTTKVSPRIT